MRKRLILLLAILLFSFTIVSCSRAKETAVEQPEIVDESRLEDVVESDIENKQSGVGTEKDDNAQSDNHFVLPEEGSRPYAIMIDNEGTKSLPQGGLDKAQVIYEIIVEGGETRLMPVFWGTAPQLIGPVRSARHYFLDYAMEHDAIYIHFGWSPMAMNDIPKFKINNINGVANGGEVFWDLTEDRYNWQDSYTSEEKITAYVNKVKYRTDTSKGLVFTYNNNDVEFENGQKAEKISLKYSQTYTCGFIYDDSTKIYKRFRKGQAQMERSTGRQLEAKNILIQFANNYTIKGDTEGRQEVNTVGSGNGWLVSMGKAIKIKWSKDSRTSPTVYTDENGKIIMLNPGQTWVQVVPTSSNVTLE
jgi:hypothetical protein